MTVNQVPYAPIVRIHPGGNPADAASWGPGVDISAKVRYPGSDGGQPITYQAGRPDQGSRVDPGQLGLTLDDRGGEFSTANVNSPYYGQLKRGTPITLGLLSGQDVFDRTVSGGLGTSSGGGVWTSTAIWSTDGSSGSAAIAVANFASAPTLGDADAANLDGRLTVWPTVAATGAALVYGVRARATDTSNFLMFSVEFATGGAVDLKIRRSVGGVFTTLAASTGFSTYVANDKWRIRWQCDGPALRLKAWAPANPADPDADEPDAWSLTTTDTVMTDAGQGFYFWRVVGNTNAGTVDFKASDYQLEATEFVGSVVKWPVDWDLSGNNCWAAIQAAGTLRRLQQGSGRLQSPLRRQLAAYSPGGFWPLEDGPSARSFAPADSSAQPATFDQVTPGASSDLPGAFAVATFDAATSSIVGRTGGSTAGQTGFSAMWLMKLSASPGADTLVARIRASGRLTRWEIVTDGASLTVKGFEGGDGTPVVSNTALFGADVIPTEWFACQLETETSGGTTSWAFITHAVGSVVYYAQSGSYSSSTASVASYMRLGGTLLSGASFSMMWLGPNTLPFVTDSFSLVSNGYDGELAAARAERVAGEAGIPIFVEPGDSEPMGPQTESTALDVLRSCETTDYAILYEYGSAAGFRPRVARYNPESVVTLTVAAGQISAAPSAVLDDQNLRNVWTVSRPGGSDATVSNEESIALEGEIAGSDTVNVATDDVLPNHAAWRTYLGTQEVLRWPSIVIDLARNESLLPFWRSKRYGFRFAVTTGRTQVAGAEPDVIAEGHQVSLTPHQWTATLNCSGAAPWDVAVIESATTPVRLDTAGCELASGVNTTTLTWTADTTDGPAWNPSTTFPILMACEGEVVSVASITGAGPSGQVLNLDARSVNGVVKDHDAGAAVSLAYPSRLAL